MNNISFPGTTVACLACVFFANTAMAQMGFPPARPPIPRAELLKRFDKDANGKLSDAERDAMRQERITEKVRQEQSGRRGFRPPVPPETVKKFDKDGDGELNDDEMQAVFDDMRKRMEEVTRQYDKNKDGRLDEEEFETVRADIDSGKLTGLPPFFGRGRRGGPFGGPRQNPGASRTEILKKSDINNDGKLDENELRAAREALRQNQPPK